MSRTFLMTYMVVALGTTAWGNSNYNIADRLDSKAIDDFKRELANRAGVTVDNVVIINMFELEQP